MTPRLGRRALLGAAVMVLAVAGAAVGWWWYNAAPPPAPPMPRNIEETEVREAIEAARAGVLQEPRSAGAWGRLGMMLLAHLFSEDADRCFAEAARLDPSDARSPCSPRPDRPEARPRRRRAAAAPGGEGRRRRLAGRPVGRAADTGGGAAASAARSTRPRKSSAKR